MSKNIVDPACRLPESADIRVVFFDIDGTLLNVDGHYSKHTAQQIKRLQDLGVKTAAATGRPSFAAQFLVDELGLGDMGVFCTGSHVYEPHSNRALIEHTLEPVLAKVFLQAVRDKGLYYELYSGSEYCVDHDLAPNLRLGHARHLRSTPLTIDAEQWLASNMLHKYLVAADLSIQSDPFDDLEQQFPDLIFAYAQFPAFPTWKIASVIPKNASKASAFSSLLDYYKVQAHQVASFGDSHSDMVFLKSAGFGIAMGNAAPSVQQVANFVTRPVNDDGVAYAIKWLLNEV